MEFEWELEFEGLHLLALAFSAVVILLADHDGLRYLRGREATLDPKRLRRLHRLVWLGLSFMIVTGALLLIEELDVLEEPAFYVKLLMVLGLVVNGVFIGRLSARATTTPFAELLFTQRLPLFLSGAVSACCWLGAALIGFFWL